MIWRWNSLLTSSRAASATRRWEADDAPRFLASCSGPRAAASACCAVAFWRLTNSSEIWPAAVLMNVPGP